MRECAVTHSLPLAGQLQLHRLASGSVGCIFPNRVREVCKRATPWNSRPGPEGPPGGCRGFLDLLRLSKYERTLGKVNVLHFRRITREELLHHHGLRLGAANRLLKVPPAVAGGEEGSAGSERKARQGERGRCWKRATRREGLCPPRWACRHSPFGASSIWMSRSRPRRTKATTSAIAGIDGKAPSCPVAPHCAEEDARVSAELKGKDVGLHGCMRWDDDGHSTNRLVKRGV